MALIEIACGPIGEAQTAEEIPFVCSIFTDRGGQVGVMYGVGSNIDIDHQWKEAKIPAHSLREWISSSIETGIYEAGKSDIFIASDDGRVQVTLCHEADIHLNTPVEAVLRACVDRWLSNGYRVLRRSGDSVANEGWRQIRSTSQAIEGCD